MSHQSELIATDIDAYLEQHEQKELLRFLTCGSVDDGKSTLIGRLLYDSKMIYEDQLAAIQQRLATHGTTGGEFDPALLTDGLKAEREQGITIDVAYRYFSTAKRKFIIADYARPRAVHPQHGHRRLDLRPGDHPHRRPPRRDDADQAALVHRVAAGHQARRRRGQQDGPRRLQSRRSSSEIKSDYRDFAARLDMPDLHFIPISALKGDNVVDHSENMPWYEGSHADAPPGECATSPRTAT